MRHDPDVESWHYRLMHDPEFFEKFRYLDSIDDYHMIIEEFQRLYDQAGATNHYIRARSLKGLNAAKRDLAKIQAEYELFKEYKMRNAISK